MKRIIAIMLAALLILSCGVSFAANGTSNIYDGYTFDFFGNIFGEILGAVVKIVLIFRVKQSGLFVELRLQSGSQIKVGIQFLGIVIFGRFETVFFFKIKVLVKGIFFGHGISLPFYGIVKSILPLPLEKSKNIWSDCEKNALKIFLRQADRSIRIA